MNNGASWEYSSTGMGSFGQIRAIAVIPSVTSTLYVGKAQEGVWKTTDDGLTWEGCNNGFDIDAHFGISIRSLAADPLNPNHLSRRNRGHRRSTRGSLSDRERWPELDTCPSGTNLHHKSNPLRGRVAERDPRGDSRRGSLAKCG